MREEIIEACERPATSRRENSNTDDGIQKPEARTRQAGLLREGEEDSLPQPRRADAQGRLEIEWSLYWAIRNTDPELVGNIHDLRGLSEGEHALASVFALRWLTGWPGFVDSDGCAHVRGADGSLLSLKGFRGTFQPDMRLVTAHQLRAKGYTDIGHPRMAMLCRDAIRLLGNDLGDHLINLPGPPGPSHALRAYARDISESLGIPMPETITKGSLGAFVGEHKGALFKARKDAALAKGAQTRAENVAARLEAGLPVRRPPNPLRNDRKPWTDKELSKLGKLWEEAKPIPEIALSLGRSEGLIASRLNVLGLIDQAEMESLVSAYVRSKLQAN